LWGLILLTSCFIKESEETKMNYVGVAIGGFMSGLGLGAAGIIGGEFGFLIGLISIMAGVFIVASAAPSID
jgi:hypothetical protein